MSASGAFLFSPSSAATSRLVWVSRQGVEQPITEVRRPYQNPRLAPLGQRIAVGLVDGDLWLQDIARTTFAKITSNETVGNTYPVWTADGTGVVFRTRTGLYRAAVDGSSRPEAILDTSVADIPSSISADGETLAFQRVTASTSSDVYVVNLRGDPKPRAVVNTPAFEGGADFSPDGRWLAYASDESGQMQVYLRPFPGPDRKSPVSTQGGSSPRWSKDGKELFYRSGNRMMAVEVATDHELTLSRPQVLFEQRYAFGRTVTGANYDVAADSQRFVMVKEEAGAGRFNLVLNWTEELKRLVPPK
jgi:Tol biopolymer transport system component